MSDIHTTVEYAIRKQVIELEKDNRRPTAIMLNRMAWTMLAMELESKPLVDGTHQRPHAYMGLALLADPFDTRHSPEVKVLVPA